MSSLTAKVVSTEFCSSYIDVHVLKLWYTNVSIWNS